MKSNIFIPKRIMVGYQNRSDTYTKKLAYVIYYDEKEKLRKEASWNSWRANEIEPQEFDNVPTSGFVLNKKVGDYDSGWSHRHAYCRIYDSRDFEFEITISNLLYILENATSTKGKGLEGEFVYGWDGKDILLIPVDSPDYKSIMKLNDKRENNTKLKGNDLAIGGTYLTVDNEEIIYIGRYDYHGSRKNKKEYFFYKRNKTNEYSDNFVSYPAIGNVIIETISETCISDYADIFDKFEYHENYNPYDEEKDELIPHTLESFTSYIMSQQTSYHATNWNYDDICFYSYTTDALGYSYRNEYHKSCNFYYDKNKFIYSTNEKIEDKNSLYAWNKYKNIRVDHELTIEEFYKKYQPMYKKEYLADGKLRKVKYYE